MLAVPEMGLQGLYIGKTPHCALATNPLPSTRAHQPMRLLRAVLEMLACMRRVVCVLSMCVHTCREGLVHRCVY